MVAENGVEKYPEFVAIRDFELPTLDVQRSLFTGFVETLAFLA